MTIAPSVALSFVISILIGVEGALASNTLRDSGAASIQRFILEDGQHTRKGTSAFPSLSPNEIPCKHYTKFDSNGPSVQPTVVPSSGPTSHPTPASLSTIPSFRSTPPDLSNVRITEYPTEGSPSHNPTEEGSSLRPSHKVVTAITRSPMIEAATHIPFEIPDNKTQSTSDGNDEKHINNLPPNYIGNKIQNILPVVIEKYDDSTNGSYEIVFKDDPSAEKGKGIKPFQLILTNIFCLGILIVLMCGICVRTFRRRRIKDSEINMVDGDTPAIPVLSEQSKNLDSLDEVILEEGPIDGLKSLPVLLRDGKREVNTCKEKFVQKDAISQEETAKIERDNPIIENRHNSTSQEGLIPQKDDNDEVEREHMKQQQDTKESVQERNTLEKSIPCTDSKDILLDGMKEKDEDQEKPEFSSKTIFSKHGKIAPGKDLYDTKEATETNGVLVSQGTGDIREHIIQSTHGTLEGDDQQTWQEFCDEQKNSNVDYVHSGKDTNVTNHSLTKTKDCKIEKLEENNKRHNEDDTDSLSSEDLEYLYGTLPMDKLPSTPRTSNCMSRVEDGFTTSSQSRSKPCIPFGRGASFVKARYSSNHDDYNHGNDAESLCWI